MEQSSEGSRSVHGSVGRSQDRAGQVSRGIVRANVSRASVADRFGLPVLRGPIEIQRRFARLTASARRLYGAILASASSADGICFASRVELAACLERLFPGRRTPASERQVSRLIGKLERAGLVVRGERRAPRSEGGNFYVLFVLGVDERTGELVGCSEAVRLWLAGDRETLRSLGLTLRAADGRSIPFAELHRPRRERSSMTSHRMSRLLSSESECSSKTHTGRKIEESERRDTSRPVMAVATKPNRFEAVEDMLAARHPRWPRFAQNYRAFVADFCERTFADDRAAVEWFDVVAFATRDKTNPPGFVVRLIQRSRSEPHLLNVWRLLDEASERAFREQRRPPPPALDAKDLALASAAAIAAMRENAAEPAPLELELSAFERRLQLAYERLRSHVVAERGASRRPQPLFAAACRIAS
ncbi:MAG: helix-turn-helix domain-containing protein [Planctomycetes bacterium]|nr:helix-turn-helix domain-containing protein [Planctomycetota bacterium]